MNEPTTAKKIADRFHNDGLCWADEIGSVPDAIRDAGGKSYDLADGGAVAIFADGSAMFTADMGWDLAFEIDGDWYAGDDTSLPLGRLK